MSFIHLKNNATNYASKHALASAMVHVLKANPEFPDNDALTLSVTNTSLILKLHNEEGRPTTYQAYINGPEDEMGMHIPSITVDVLIMEDKRHVCEKKINLPIEQALTHLLHYAKQPCNGHPDITLLKYQALGLMMVERSKPEPPINVTFEALEAINLASQVVNSSNKSELVIALIDAFNEGVKDGRLWADEYLDQKVSELVFGDKTEKFIPGSLSPHNAPFSAAKYNDALYVTLDAVTKGITRSHRSLTDGVNYRFSSRADKLTRRITKEHPKALTSLSLSIQSDDYATISDQFKGLDTATAGGFDLVRNLRPNNFTYNLEEQRRGLARTLISSVYTHGIGVATEKNTRSAISAMRDTVILQSAKGFNVDNGEVVINGLNQSSYLGFCLEIQKKDLVYVTPQSMEALKIMAEERMAKPPEDNKSVSNIIDEIMKEIDTPEYLAKEKADKISVYVAGEAYKKNISDFQVNSETVIGLLRIREAIVKLPALNDEALNKEFTHCYLKAEAEKLGYTVSGTCSGDMNDFLDNIGITSPDNSMPFDMTSVANVRPVVNVHPDAQQSSPKDFGAISLKNK